MKAPQLPKWMYAVWAVGALIYLTFVGLILAALALGVRWLWNNV